MYLHRHLFTLALVTVHTISFCPDAQPQLGPWGSALIHIAQANNTAGALMALNNRVLPAPLITAGKTTAYVGVAAEMLGLDPEKTKKSLSINYEAFGTIQSISMKFDMLNIISALNIPRVEPQVQAQPIPNTQPLTQSLVGQQNLNKSTIFNEQRACHKTLLYAVAHLAIFGAGHATYLLLSTERGEDFLRKLAAINNAPEDISDKEEKKEEQPSGAAAQLIASSGTTESDEKSLEEKNSCTQETASSALIKKSNPEVTPEQIERYKITGVILAQATTTFVMCQWAIPKALEKLK